MLLDLTISWLSNLHGVTVYGAIFLLLFLCGVGMPLAQDVLVLAVAGLGLHALPLVVCAWLGIVAGDAVTFYLGHHYGARWIRGPRLARFIPPDRLPRWEEGARRIALPFSFVTRFLPGMRSTLFFAGGTLRMPYRPFLLGNGAGALVYLSLLTYGVHALGWRWQQWQAPIDRADDLLTAVLVLALVLAWLRGRRHA